LIDYEIKINIYYICIDKCCIYNCFCLINEVDYVDTLLVYG